MPLPVFVASVHLDLSEVNLIFHVSSVKNVRTQDRFEMTASVSFILSSFSPSSLEISSVLPAKRWFVHSDWGTCCMAKQCPPTTFIKFLIVKNFLIASLLLPPINHRKILLAVNSMLCSLTNTVLQAEPAGLPDIPFHSLHILSASSQASATCQMQRQLQTQSSTQGLTRL